MLRSYINLLMGVLLVLISSCTKKEDVFKLPTKVEFNMDVNRAVCLGGNLSFDGGGILLSYFTFDGKREQGGDVYFSNAYDEKNGLYIPYAQTAIVPELRFDIPQGVYSQIKISYKTYGNQGDKQITITGSYLNTINSVTYPVVFEYKSAQTYVVFAKAKGGGEIVLDAKTGSTVNMKMDPVYWFQDVTTSAMDAATLTTIGGVQTILINNNTNQSIYLDIKDRVKEDPEIVFN